jgi:hypothetical protein
MSDQDKDREIERLKCDLAHTQADRDAALALVDMRQRECAELEAWKESALKVIPDFQAIGKLLELPLGTDVLPEIIPWITHAKASIVEMAHHISRLEQRLREAEARLIDP